MLNLHLLPETFTNGFPCVFLDFLFLVTILCSILVITSKNPIISVLFLIGLFLAISAYLMMIGANFIGLSYLLVYVGAVSILFLFILMLINVRISELVSDTGNSIPLVIFVTILFNLTLYAILPIPQSGLIMDELSKYDLTSYLENVISLYPEDKQILQNDSDSVLYVSSVIWDKNLAETSHISTIGNILYTGYPLWLIIISIILLLAMVGAIVITIKQETKLSGKNFKF